MEITGRVFFFFNVVVRVFGIALFLDYAQNAANPPVCIKTKQGGVNTLIFMLMERMSSAKRMFY